MPDAPVTSPANAYRFGFVARGYDLLNALLWMPTGSDRLRQQLVEMLEIGPEDRVLELGCGTGLATRHLCATGASVTAIDSAPQMLDGARRRAPSAHFVVADLRAEPEPDELDVIDGPYDQVALAFVLHELDLHHRTALLTRAAAALAPGGRIGILEWALPRSAMGAGLWRSVVRLIEPPVALEVLDGGLDQAVAAAGLRVGSDERLAAGRARILVVAPAAAAE